MTLFAHLCNPYLINLSAIVFLRASHSCKLGASGKLAPIIRCGE